MKKSNKGFTLMEMLIVIAIIAILIAIAIPTFNSALEKSRQKTDLANARSLKSLVIADFMADEKGAVATALGTTGATFYIKEGGQELVLAANKDTTACIKVQAQWKDETYGKGDYVTCTFDSGCAITGSVPDLPDIPS